MYKADWPVSGLVKRKNQLSNTLRIFIVSILVCNNAILRTLFLIEQKRLQWYGHVKRMPEERIPKLIMDWIPRERRKRGSPKKMWMEGVQAVMTTRNLEPDQYLKIFCVEYCYTDLHNTQLLEDTI